MSAINILAGSVHRVSYPFVRSTYYAPDEDGGSEVATWNPGVRHEAVGPYGENTATFADGQGYAVYTVVDVHKLPAPYPTRVFYTRRFITPAGHEFGKGKLHITTLDAFRRRVRGFVVPFSIALSEAA